VIVKPDAECRVCKGPALRKGLLSQCVASKCAAAHWDKTAIKKKIISVGDDAEKGKQARQKILLDSGVSSDFQKAKNHHFVYVLRLRGKPANSVYVGMTGLHPHERYLNHLWGYKSSATAKKRATAMVKFEGPVSYAEAKERETGLAEELEGKGYVVTQN